MLNGETMQTNPITPAEEAQFSKTIKTWASEGLRTFALAYRDYDEAITTNEEESIERDLTLLAIVGIKDPLRKEIPGAVAMCQKAGLMVRMVTGDNILTATKIAKECNIFFGDGIAIEGPAFRALSENEKIEMLPRLQVVIGIEVVTYI
jgi:Ca2+-transporting ATPase